MLGLVADVVDVLQGCIRALHGTLALHINNMQCIVRRDALYAKAIRCKTEVGPCNAFGVAWHCNAMAHGSVRKNYNAMRMVDCIALEGVV